MSAVHSIVVDIHDPILINKLTTTTKGLNVAQDIAGLYDEVGGSKNTGSFVITDTISDIILPTMYIIL